MPELSRYCFLAGAVPFLVLGLAHVLATPLDPASVRGLSPSDPALVKAMSETTMRLTRRTDMWRAWVGFNLSHSLGAVLFAVVVLLIGRSESTFAVEGPLFRPLAVLVAGTYLWLGRRYWFRTPIIGCAVSTSLFVASWVLAAAAPAPRGGVDADDRSRERETMVTEQVESRGVRDPLVLAALRSVPRHLFVPPEAAGQAYGDHPLPIGHDQTISQPYIVAFMTEALGLKGGETVLEVGTGSGYQAAVLSLIAKRTYSIEIVAPLAEEARARLARLGYASVDVRAGDGYQGWPEAAPFDAIIVTAAAPKVPEPLKAQLREGGRLVIPVGDEYQELMVITRRAGAFEERRLLPVRFVPMTGKVRG